MSSFLARPFVWGWVPIFLEHDFSGVSENDSIPSAMLAPTGVVVPVSERTFFFEMFMGPIYISAPECKAYFSTRVGMFLHKTKVHGCKSPTIVHFKGNKCPRCKSEKSANDHYRRNLKRKSCAKPRGPDASHVPPRRSAPSPPKNRGKRGGKRLWTQQTLCGVLGFDGSSWRTRRWSWWQVEQASSHYHPRRVTLAAGLLNALSVINLVINLAKADQQQQTIIARQDKLLAIVNKPSIAKQKDMWGQLLKMYTTPDQLLPEIAACVWFKAKKSEKYLLSLTIHTWSPLHRVWDFTHTALMCAGAQLQDGLSPGGPQAKALLWVPTGHAALPVAAVRVQFCPECRRLSQHCHLQRPTFFTFFCRTETL